MTGDGFEPTVNLTIKTGPIETFKEALEGIPAFTRFLNHAVRSHASDIFIQSGIEAKGLVHGKLETLTAYKLTGGEIELIAQIVAKGTTITSSVAAGRDYDTAFNVPNEIGHKDPEKFAGELRFRLNATAIYGRDHGAMQIVLRHVPADPPSLKDIGFPEELYGEIGIEQGAFFIAGETGSGKTTTFAACIRHIMEGKTRISGNLLTYEHPIEFTFGQIESKGCIIAQSEVGRHIASFAEGVRNAMRRKPALIVVGEMRDPATILAANNAAVTGHPVYATVHASNSAAIIRRMLSQYPQNEQPQVFGDLAMNVRILMSQTLAEKKGGGRICLRDWIIVNPERSEAIIEEGITRHAILLRKWMKEGVKARSMQTSISIAYRTGQITEETRDALLKRYGYAEMVEEGT